MNESGDRELYSQDEVRIFPTQGSPGTSQHILKTFPFSQLPVEDDIDLSDVDLDDLGKDEL